MRPTETSDSDDPARGGQLCARCRHYWVTHEVSHPHGCHAFGMKAATAPSILVERESGRPCQAFEGRPGRHQGR